MKCPHCLIEYHDSVEIIPVGKDADGHFELQRRICPNCKKMNLHLVHFVIKRNLVSSGKGYNEERVDVSTRLIRPKIANRSPVALEVPSEFASDYSEACLVIDDSPKASAALSRRCLQNIIRDHLKIKKKDLNLEIQEVIDSKLFPSDILESIDGIRNIGNFAAHPIKSVSSGEIVEVEQTEADWNLDVLEMIFDYLFVRPALIKKKRDALNSKLKDAGKPDMK